MIPFWVGATMLGLAAFEFLCCVVVAWDGIRWQERAIAWRKRFRAERRKQLCIEEFDQKEW